MILRPHRVWAVALRDLRQRTGRHWYRLPLTALLLLLPAGILGMELSGPVAPTRQTGSGSALPIVAGDIPGALADRLVRGSGSDVTLSGGNPLIARGVRVPNEIRRVLDTLPGADAVTVRRYRPPVRLPGRSLLIALLAISLLTGPLAESLPGERARHTLEVLLSAGISRAELVGGKWLAWTSAATSTALLAAASSVVSGVQAGGWWIAALPIFIATAVALGLWLVRGVADIVGGAAAPMRVLPVVSMAMAGAAYAAGSVHPLLGVSVPLGGALLVAADVYDGPAALAATALASSGWIALLLAGTARGLDRAGETAEALHPRVLGVLVAALVAWWMPVASPAVWKLAGNAGAAGSMAAAVGAGGLALLAIATITEARALVPARHEAGRAAAGPAVAIGAGLGLVALLLVTAVPAGGVSLVPSPFAERLLAGMQPAASAGTLAILAAVLGQALVFFRVLAGRCGATVAATTWILVVGIASPVAGTLTGLAAAYAWTRAGTLAAGTCLAIVALFA